MRPTRSLLSLTVLLATVAAPFGNVLRGDIVVFRDRDDSVRGLLQYVTPTAVHFSADGADEVFERSEVVLIVSGDEWRNVATQEKSDVLLQGGEALRGRLLYYAPHEFAIVESKESLRVQLLHDVISRFVLSLHTAETRLDSESGRALEARCLKAMNKLAKKKRFRSAARLGEACLSLLPTERRSESLRSAIETCETSHQEWIRSSFSVDDLRLLRKPRAVNGKRIDCEHLVFAIKSRPKEFEGLVAEIAAQTASGEVYFDRFTYYTVKPGRRHVDAVAAHPDGVRLHGSIVRYRLRLEFEGVEIATVERGEPGADGWWERGNRHFYRWPLASRPARDLSSWSLAKVEVDGPPRRDP